MKQSTKLLSLVLALIMAFSCMTVIGNASLVQSEVEWDSIDDSALTPEQVADLALDLVDNDLLAGMETIDLSIIGSLRLNSINNIATDIIDLRCSFIWTIGSGLLGDLADLDFTPLNQDNSVGWSLFSSNASPIQRSQGDLYVVGQLLKFIGNSTNAGILSKVAYGIGTDSGVDLGLIDSFLSLGDLGDDLANIPNMVVEMIYDMLVYGSYNTDYENESYPSLEDLENAGSALPTDMDSLDEILNNALLNLLINPQDYTWVDEDEDGEAETKDWDEGSVILPGVAEWTATYGRDAAISYISPLNQSLFAILDIIAQFAIDDIGINALNNNLKKALMEAVEIDLNEIEAGALPDAVATDFEVSANDGEESYVTYLAYDRMMGYNGSYYYTTMKSAPVDANGDGVQDTDAETGEELYEKVRKYYKANMASGNEFASLINWDWEFVDSATTPSGTQKQLLYSNIVKDYDNDGTTSIVEGINDLLYLVYDVALTDEVKADFTAFVGNETGYVSGSNANLMTNINNIAKYLLVNFGELVFGSTSPYAHLTKEEVINLDTVDLIEKIGPSFFEDVMPQLIFPKNEDGTYAFHDGVQIYEFGALVIREFITDIAPNVNYDAYIFAEASVTSANDRKFVEKGADAWFNLILNMGMDIAYTYLYNISNFGDTITYSSVSANTVTMRDNDDPEYPDLSSDTAYSEDRWMGMLDDVIMWCVRYVGGFESSSILKGLDADTVETYTNPLDKLSYILNSILPLGMINGYETDEFAFDIKSFFTTGVKGFFADFDLARVLGLLGRNMSSVHYNPLADTNLVNAVLRLVNNILDLVFRDTTVLNGVNTDASTESLDEVIGQENLKGTVYSILNGLYTNKDAILNNALPVVGKLIKGWGTEQAFNPPQISLSNSVALTDGATTATVTIRNASNGVWRHYRDPKSGEYKTDSQYKILVTNVKAYDGMDETEGNSSAYVTVALGTQSAVDYGGSTTFSYTASNVPEAGALVRFEVYYQVYDESGNAMADGKSFIAKKYVWFNYNGTDEKTETYWDNNGSISYAAFYAPHYVPLSTATEYIPEIVTGRVGRDYKFLTSSQDVAITPATATVDGITMGTVSTSISNSSGGRYYNNIQQFKTATYTAVNEDGEAQSNTITVSGDFDEETWKAANKTAGTKSTWSVTLTAKGTKNTASDFVLNYYDDIYQQKLATLAANELSEMRLASTYNLSGTYYAGSLLRTNDYEDEDGEMQYRDTNFTTTAWIDADNNAYDESAVTVTRTEYVEDGKTQTAVKETVDGVEKYVAAKSGTVTVDDEKVAVKLVTAIDGTQAINDYVAAFTPGIRGGLQEFNANTVYNVQELYEALYVTSKDVNYCKKTTEQLVEEGSGDNVDPAITALKSTLAKVEAETTDQRNYTDYKMWRLNRLNDAREDARYYINLQNDASNSTVDEIDESFPYTWIEEDDLRALIPLNTALQIEKDDENIVTALLEKLTDEEIKAKAEWLENKKLEYATQELLDVEMASSYLVNMSNRLLPKYDAVITTYLDDELTSIDNMFDTPISVDETDEGEIVFTENETVAAKYTERSWNKFVAAYKYAFLLSLDMADVPCTQKNVFDAKYELMCCRNELVLVDDEADYSELEELIAQAEVALAHPDLYSNPANEIGMVLAELGVKENIVNADGDTINLFPDSAYYINSEPYDVDDQDEIDDAATALKEALARLKFKDTIVTRVDGSDIDNVTIKEAETDEEEDEILANVTRISDKLDASAVKALFQATAADSAYEVTVSIVSDDVNYSAMKDLEGLVGTNATVTFYATIDDVKIPVATVKLVVDGDVNGDGVVDVIDAAIAQLVSVEHAELEGAYLLAGDLVSDDIVIDGNDYAQVVNKAIA